MAPISPEEMIAVITRRFGVHRGYHALHAKGAYFSGTFRATDAARAISVAPHMQGGDAEVIARLSNGAGDPGDPDYAPDVRGLAVGIELSDGSRTDIVAQTTPRIPIATPDAFAQILKLAKPSLGTLASLPAFLARNPMLVSTARTNLATMKPPASFATRAFYGVHAFSWHAPDETTRWVRYTLVPEDHTPDPRSAEAKAAGRDYLFEEMARRLAAGPARWTLRLQIAAAADDPHRANAHWPEDRETIDAGTLELTAPSDPDGPVIFDPMRLCEGIEPSDDPILHYRPGAYGLSYEQRTATT